MIIGLTGSLAAGKGVVSDFFKEKGFVYLSLSDEIRAVANEQKIELTRKNLQDLGNFMREKEGSAVLAKIVTEKIRNQKYNYAIIDSIRNPAEIEHLRKNLKNFFLINVDAPKEERFKRIVKRNRESDPNSWEAFLALENKDRGLGELESGQRVGKCMKMADFKIINDCSLNELNNKIEDIYEETEKRIPRPSWDEYFMEIANTVAKRATCSRGRSGCVIAKDKQILVTGYVGSPPGFPHCDEVGHQMKTVIHEDGHETQHCVRTTHAEQNAISQAAKLGIPLLGSTLYCRMTPCTTCARLIVTSGIAKVICEKKYHAGAESEEIFRKAGVKIEFFSDSIQEYKNQ